MKKNQTKKVQVSRTQAGGKKVSRVQFRNDLSEQARQSFYAEGIKVSKKDWDRVSKRVRSRSGFRLANKPPKTA